MSKEFYQYNDGVIQKTDRMRQVLVNKIDFDLWNFNQFTWRENLSDWTCA